MIDIKEHKLSELIEKQLVQEIQESFRQASGMTAYVTDENGKMITSDRASGIFKKTFASSGALLSGGGSDSLFSCGGVHYIAAPIVITGKRIGLFVAGEVLTGEPDENSAQKYASDLGMSTGEYVSEVSTLKIVSEAELRNYAPLVNSFAKLISSKAQSEHLKLLNSDDSAIGGATSMVAKFSEAEALIKTNAETLEKLRTEFTQLEAIAAKSVSEVTSTKDTVKVIQDIAMNTRILGFNAYIEAARAKEYGKSFGVITQEIRDLADRSKESADKIEDSMTTINGFSKQIDAQVKSTESYLSDCISNSEKFSSILSFMVSQGKDPGIGEL